MSRWRARKDSLRARSCAGTSCASPRRRSSPDWSSGLAGSLSGSILVETIFNWQGMGQLYFQAIGALDEAVVVALTFIFTLLYVVLRFLLDVLYLALDPRVRYG